MQQDVLHTSNNYHLSMVSRDAHYIEYEIVELARSVFSDSSKSYKG